MGTKVKTKIDNDFFIEYNKKSNYANEAIAKKKKSERLKIKLENFTQIKPLPLILFEANASNKEFISLFILLT